MKDEGTETEVGTEETEETEEGTEIACDCDKRANVVLHVGLWKEIFARKHTATHKPTSAQPLYSYQGDIHTSNNRLWSP